MREDCNRRTEDRPEEFQIKNSVVEITFREAILRRAYRCGDRELCYTLRWMTIDERLQFLLQSTESLHSSLQDLTTDVAQLRISIADLTRVVEIDADNIRRLANIAAAH